MRIAYFYFFLLLSVTRVWSGLIEHTECCAVPSLGKTVFMFGEEHTDPLNPEAMAQRQELTNFVNEILNSHDGAFSCYLECDSNVQKSVQESPYFYLRNVCDQGAFFEQWYIPLARTFGNEVGIGRIAISNFDIRDDQYAAFEQQLSLFADGEITRDKIDFNALRKWGQTIEGTVDQLFDAVKNKYPKKMISYVGRDMERKKKQFYRMIDTHCQKKSRTSYDAQKALSSFYNYTDLLADFTILNKVAHDSRDAIILNAGSAHTENLSRYFARI